MFTSTTRNGWLRTAALPDVVQHVHLQANPITLRWPGKEADAWRHGWVYMVVSEKPTDLEALHLRMGRTAKGVERFLSGVEIPEQTMQAGDPVPLRLLLPPELRSAPQIPIQIWKLVPGARQPLVKQTAFQTQELRL